MRLEMRVNNKVYLIAIALTMLVSACEKDDFTGDSRLTPTSPTISVNVTGVSTTTDEDDEDSFDILLTMDEAQIVDVAVHTTQVGGDAVLGEDYEMDERIIIPKGSTTGTITVHILSDCDIELDETLVLQVGDERTANADITPVTVNTITINNFLSPSVELHAEWTGEFADLSPTEMTDIDLYVFDDALATNYGAAFSTSFESLESDPLPDGDYVVLADFWDVHPDVSGPEFNSTFGPIEFPITLEISRCGGFYLVSTLQTIDIFATNGDPSSDGSGDFAILAFINVTGGVMTVEDQAGVQIASGRINKTKVQEALKPFRMRK